MTGYRLIIGSLGTCRGQAIQNSRLRLHEANSVIHGIMKSAACTLANAPLSGLTYGQAETESALARPCLMAGAGAQVVPSRSNDFAGKEVKGKNRRGLSPCAPGYASSMRRTVNVYALRIFDQLPFLRLGVGEFDNTGGDGKQLAPCALERRHFLSG